MRLRKIIGTPLYVFALAVAASSFGASKAFAQAGLGFGLKGGISFSEMRGADAPGGGRYTWGRGIGYAQLMFHRHFGFEANVAYAGFGATGNPVIEERWRLHYAQAAFNFCYAQPSEKTNGRFTVMGGPYFGRLLVARRLVFDESFDDADRFRDFDFGAQIAANLTTIIKPFELGIEMGAGHSILSVQSQYNPPGSQGASRPETRHFFFWMSLNAGFWFEL